MISARHKMGTATPEKCNTEDFGQRADNIMPAFHAMPHFITTLSYAKSNYITHDDISTAMDMVKGRYARDKL